MTLTLAALWSWLFHLGKQIAQIACLRKMPIRRIVLGEGERLFCGRIIARFFIGSDGKHLSLIVCRRNSRGLLRQPLSRGLGEVIFDDKLQGADLQTVAGVYRLFADHALAIEKCSIDAIEILDVHVLIIDTEQAMAATDFRREDAQLAIAAPTDDVAFVVQMPRLRLGATLIDNKSHIHGRHTLRPKSWQRRRQC